MTEFEALGPNAGVTIVKSPEGIHEFRDGRVQFTDHEPLSPAEIVTPTGAGDAFAAGYLAGLLLEDESPSPAARGLSFARRSLRTPSSHR
ncbi:PfkB family carbohydrate kinase [Cryptosporangium arvum]|uniref:Sugar kinase, ribokinase n=1 Tax=Cryptosporangium arvum DSM 44712 TaxID=927661 RepID=A0A010ZKG7_9ACTN|nr:PfkB family carbohydrate kinase [Cryptosporangium arvum]EXG79144.1 sugar kinase, ribokinase [Cryptosporangium arvum DSM 44712]